MLTGGLRWASGLAAGIGAGLGSIGAAGLKGSRASGLIGLGLQAGGLIGRSGCWARGLANDTPQGMRLFRPGLAAGETLSP